MATAAYAEWDSRDRPLEPSETIREMVRKMHALYPQAAFGWGADEAHYQADNPLDHTPYSTDDWPIQCPRYVVFATDIMPHPSYDLDVLASYWVSEARAGRTPWRKYIIYRDKSYSVRHGWEERDFDGEYHDHVHLSDRTDYEAGSLGSWNPVPQETFMFSAQIEGDAACWISTGVTYRPIKEYTTLRRYWDIGVRHVVVANESELLDLCGEKNYDGPDPITLTPEQLALVEAAAKQGAHAGDVGAIDPRATNDSSRM